MEFFAEQPERIAAVCTQTGIEVTRTSAIVKEIWLKLALNVCTLPTLALLGIYAANTVGQRWDDPLKLPL